MEVFHSSATFSVGNWSITVRGNPVYDHIAGPRHRLDVSFGAKGDTAARTLPHGAPGVSPLTLVKNQSPRELRARLSCA